MTARILRGQVAERNVKLYQLASLVGVHPTRLGQVLRERAPLTATLEAKIHSALQKLDTEGCADLVNRRRRSAEAK